MPTKTQPAGKPRVPRRSPARAKKPAAAPDTTRGLLELLAKQFDKVDALMRSRPATASVTWGGYGFGTDELQSTLRDVRSLGIRLTEVLAAEGGGTAMLDLIEQTFRTAPGATLSWSRPGSMLAWLGDIPVRCEWGGLLGRDRTTAYALSDRPFLHASGAFGFFSSWVQDATPETWMLGALRGRIESHRHPDQPLFMPLDKAGKQAVADFLSNPAGGWWAEAVKAGPRMRVIPLPRNLPAIQTSLFN